MIHEYKFRVYYKDTDASGIAYHANYLAYAERARTEMFIEAGLPLSALKERGDCFVIRRAEIDYRYPAPLESVVTIKSWISEIRPASCVVVQEFWIEDKHIATVKLQAASIDDKTLRPKRMPQDVKAVYEKYLKEGEENAK